MRKDKIAIIGEKDTVLAFKSIGFDCYSVSNEGEAREKFKALTMNYKIIYITEDYALTLNDLIERYDSKTFPIVIPLPTASGSNGYGKESVHKNVEKAIGTDILLKK